MKLTMLGTGNAVVTECYNTCFVLEDEERTQEDRYFLVDGGGGNGLLHQLKEAGISWKGYPRDVPDASSSGSSDGDDLDASDDSSEYAARELRGGGGHLWS